MKNIRLAYYGGVGGSGSGPWQPGGSPIGRGGSNPGGWDINSFVADKSFDAHIERVRNPAPDDPERNIEKRIEHFHQYNESDSIPYNLTPEERRRLKLREFIRLKNQYLEDAANRIDTNSVGYINENYGPKEEHITSIEELLSSRRKYEDGKIVRHKYEDAVPDTIKPERVHYANKDYPSKSRIRLTDEDANENPYYEAQYGTQSLPSGLTPLLVSGDQFDSYLEEGAKLDRGGMDETYNEVNTADFYPDLVMDPDRHLTEIDNEIDPNISLEANLNGDSGPKPWRSYYLGDDQNEKSGLFDHNQQKWDSVKPSWGV